METVQLQCGHCRKLIAIRVEHMGTQVKCPHCQQVVQTPPPATPPAAAPADLPPAPNLDIHQPESIFAGAESSDSLLGDLPGPKVELPAAPAPLDSNPNSPSAETDFSQFKKKPSFDKSVIPLLLLIFLVPYALMTTAFIAYLVFFAQGKSTHPFDYLPDPKSGKDKGAPRPVRLQPAPNQPLADYQRTGIGTKIQAGDLEITPQRVVLTAEGDLKLILRAKNVSKNTKFEPVNGYYLRPTKGGNEPYAFLESKTGSVANINAVDLGYHKDPKAKDQPRGDALLAPGEEITIALTTDMKFRDKHIPNIAKAASESYTWRVQVRRGFVKVDGTDISATTVIGIDFTNAEIERELKS
jgi:phage FluMu protein Com